MTASLGRTEMNRYTLEASFWLGLRSDEALESLMDATTGGEATVFTVELPPTSCATGPIDAVYALAGDAHGSAKRRLSVAFTWSHRGGFALPTMSGEIEARRFGPFASIYVRAHYASEDSAAGRLFHEALGERIGRKAFEGLVTAIELLLTPRVRRAGEGSAIR